PHRIHQREVRAVEGRQIIIVESRAFAELTILGLQRLGGPIVLDDPINARADLVYLLEIRQFREARRVFRRLSKFVMGWENWAGPKTANDVGPPIVNEVFLLVTTRDQHIEVVHPPSLPSESQSLHPFRVGWTVAALIDGGRRALEHIQMLRVLRE